MRIERASAWLTMSVICALLATAACNKPETAPSPVEPPPPNVTAVSGVAISGVPSSARVGDRLSLKATASLSDGSTQDVTAKATWESSNGVVAGVSAAGELTALAAGEVDIRASYAGVSALLHVVVAPVVATVARVTIAGLPAVLSAGDEALLKALATLSDGTTEDVTTAAAWISSNAVVAQVSTAGELTTLAPGEVDIRASYRGVDGFAHLTIGPPKTSTLAGVVSDAVTGRAVRDARVEVFGGPNTGRFAVTDGNGFYTLGLVNGSFTVNVTAAGYEATVVRVTLAADTRLDLTARPIAPVTARFNISFSKVQDTCIDITPGPTGQLILAGTTVSLSIQVIERGITRAYEGNLLADGSFFGTGVGTTSGPARGGWRVFHDYGGSIKGKVNGNTISGTETLTFTSGCDGFLIVAFNGSK